MLTYEIAKGALLIQEAGKRLSCIQTTTAKALVLFHHFRRLTNENTNYDDTSVAAAILGLAVKESDDVEYEKLIGVFYDLSLDGENIPPIGRSKQSVESIQEMKTTLTKVQYFVCQVFSFKLDYETPHKYIFEYLTQLQSLPDEVLCTVSTLIMRLVSTYYLCKRCIVYEAQEIAIAALWFCLQPYMDEYPEKLGSFKKDSILSVDEEKMRNIIDEMIMVSDVATALI